MVIDPTISNSTGDYYIASLSNLTNGSIVCMVPNCEVLCNVKEGCRNSIIDASKADVLTLKCSKNSSCYNIQCIEGPSFQANVYCTDLNSCHSSKINISKSTNVNIECTTNTKYKAACFESTFYAEESQNISVHCFYGNANTFYVNNSNQAYFLMNSSGAAIYGESISKSLTVECVSHPYANTDIYCPYNAYCIIHCFDETCQVTTVHIKDKYIRYLNISCTECISPYGYNHIDMHCANNGLYVYTAVYWNETKGTWYCSTYDCCPFDISNITCNDNKDCIINCTSNQCANKNINGANANSLILNCGKNHNQCSGAVIQCPYIDNTLCKIICNGERACSETSVYIAANITNYFNLTCNGENACENMQLTANNIYYLHSLWIECEQENACDGSVYDLRKVQSFTHFININYKKSAQYGFNHAMFNKVLSMNIIIPTTDSGVYGYDPVLNETIILNNGNFNIDGYFTSANILIMEHVKGNIVIYNYGLYNITKINPGGTSNLSIHCKSCGSNFYLSNINVTFDCDNCDSPWIHAEETTVFSMNCSNGCSGVIHCPYSQLDACRLTDINATVYVNVRIYVPDNYLYGYFYADSGCNGRNDNNECFLNFNCDGFMSDNSSKYWAGYGYWCNDNTNLVLKPPYNPNIICCPWPKQHTYYNCEPSTDCFVDCFAPNCANGIINGTLSDSLSVVVVNSNNATITILCPIGKQCNISASNAHSVSIYYSGAPNDQNNGSSINIICGKSCYGFSIYAPYVSSINFINGVTANIYAEYAKNIHIYSTNMQKFNLYAAFANNINFVCNGTCNGTIVNATNATNVSISCSSNSVSNCGWYILPSSGVVLNCYGTGCYLAEFYVPWNISTLEFNIDGCGVCNSLSQCVSAFSIGCGYQYKKKQIINASYEFCSGDDCGCDSFLTQAESNYVNNNTNSFCHVIPTPTPSGKKSELNAYIIIGACIGGILMIIIVRYFVKVRKPNAGNKEQLLSRSFSGLQHNNSEQSNVPDKSVKNNDLTD